MSAAGDLVLTITLLTAYLAALLALRLVARR